MRRLSAVLLAGCLLPSGVAQAADAILVLGARSEIDGAQESAAKQPVAEPPSVGLTFGAAQAGRTPVTVPAGSFVLPLIRTEDAPPWLRKGPTTLRLITPATGHLGSDGEKPSFRLSGRIAIEDADGRVLGEYVVEVHSELPEGYAAGDELPLSVVAKPADPDSTAPPLFSGVVIGRLEEVK